MNTVSKLIKLLFAATLVAGASANASPILTGFAQSFVPVADDGSTKVDLAKDMKLGLSGTVYSSLYVNTNGNVSFGSGMTKFAPESFDSNAYSASFLAPFFGDVDIRNGAGSIGYGNTKFKGRDAFAVTWSEVGYYPQKNDKRNTFQLVLVDRSDTGANNFDFYYNYGSIEWDQASSSKSRAGFQVVGTAADFEFVGSGATTQMLDSGSKALVKGSNVGVNGRYAFNVRGGVAAYGLDGASDPAQVPLPGTLPLLGIGAIALAYGRRRKA